MNFSIPECKEVLVLAPHPDDEALGCAGTLMLLNQKGVSSTIVFFTNGESLYENPSPVIGEKRREEGLRASEMLGCNEPLFLVLPDGAVGAHKEEIYNKLADIITLKKPDMIFSPSLIDYHQDHIATSSISLSLLKNIKSFTLVFYEVYSAVRFSHLIDISEVIEQKKQIILTYKTSLYENPDVYVHAFLGLNAHRSVFVQKKGYYEAFYIPESTDDEESVLRYLCYKDQ